MNGHNRTEITGGVETERRKYLAKAKLPSILDLMDTI